MSNRRESDRSGQRDKKIKQDYPGGQQGKSKVYLKFTVTLAPAGLTDRSTEVVVRRDRQITINKGFFTRHWSQLRPVTRRLQKQSPLTGSHWELPDTVPRWSHRHAGGTPHTDSAQ